MSGHGRTVCSCGFVISRCRCMGPHDPDRIVQHTGLHAQPTVTAALAEISQLHGPHDDIAFLTEIATQLDSWARESVRGGWSTHQVDPMRKLADRIWVTIGRRAGDPAPKDGGGS